MGSGLSLKEAVPPETPSESFYLHGGGMQVFGTSKMCHDGHPRGLAILAWLLPPYENVLIPRIMPSAPRICFVEFCEQSLEIVSALWKFPFCGVVGT